MYFSLEHTSKKNNAMIKNDMSNFMGTVFMSGRYKHKQR